LHRRIIGIKKISNFDGGLLFSNKRHCIIFLPSTMGFIRFEKNQLINLEYSLNKEMLRSNRAGSFSCTTIIGCNTRKYHGLLVCPQPMLNNANHVLLSKVDETIIQHDAEFNLGINRYPGTYNPRGHKYVRDFSADILPKITYRVGGVVFTKETLFITQEEKVMIRYTLVEAQSPTMVRIKPFLAFRNIHELSKKNIYLNTKYEVVPNGIRTRMYDGYSFLYMQFSRAHAEYVHAPDWYNDLEYYNEQERGYEFREDLYVPGFFEFSMKKGESIIFCAGTEPVKPLAITRSFNKEIKNRVPRDSYENSIDNAAGQFFYQRGKETDIVAGFPWYDRIGRFTFMALPGLSLAREAMFICRQVIDTMVKEMKGPFFPETGRANNTSFLSADTSLWFIWALQQCCYTKEEKAATWKKYGKVVRNILESYAGGNDFIEMHENKLLHIDDFHPGLTWMNAVANGKYVTPRYGYVVEVNALWHNAIVFAVEAADTAGETTFVKKWSPLPPVIRDSFADTFWNESLECLYDFVHDGVPDLNIRPNQVIAASLPNSPLSELMIKNVLDVIKGRLLTPKGLRTLSPENPLYRGRYSGNEEHRNLALHQGTVHPWLLGHFAEAYLKIYQTQGVEFVEFLYDSFRDEMTEHGIGTISELYDGDPPHPGKGAISFAASVSELVRMRWMIDKYLKGKK